MILGGILTISAAFRVDGRSYELEPWLQIGRSRSTEPNGQVDVWRVELGMRPSASPDDVRLRRSLTALALRSVLAAYLDAQPDAIRIVRGAFGKPMLGEPVRGRSVCFNVSRCDDRCLIAVSRSAEVGIDLERMAPRGELDELAIRSFAPSEARAIGRARGRRKVTAFYRCWTRKEAYVKALGKGLAIPFDGFTVSVGARARVLTSEEGDAGDWMLLALHPWPRHVGALAVARGPRDSRVGSSPSAHAN